MLKVECVLKPEHDLYTVAPCFSTHTPIAAGQPCGLLADGGHRCRAMLAMIDEDIGVVGGALGTHTAFKRFDGTGVPCQLVKRPTLAEADMTYAGT